MPPAYRDAINWIGTVYRVFGGLKYQMRHDEEFRNGEGKRMVTEMLKKLPNFRDLLLRAPIDVPELYQDAAEKAQWLLDEAREFTVSSSSQPINVRS